MLRRELARPLERLAGTVEVPLCLRGGSLALRDQGKPEPRIRVVAGRPEELIRPGDVAALQRREAGLLLLRRPPLRDHAQAALRRGIVAVGPEDALGLGGIAAIESAEARLQRGGVPGAFEASSVLRVGGMGALVGAKQRNRGVFGRKPEERPAPGRGGVLAHRRIPRRRRQHLDALAPGLLPIGEDLSQLELEARLALGAADDAPEPFPRPLPRAWNAGQRLVVLEREIAGRPRLAE